MIVLLIHVNTDTVLTELTDLLALVLVDIMERAVLQVSY